MHGVPWHVLLASRSRDAHALYVVLTRTLSMRAVNACCLRRAGLAALGDVFINDAFGTAHRGEPYYSHQSHIQSHTYMHRWRSVRRLLDGLLACACLCVYVGLTLDILSVCCA